MDTKSNYFMENSSGQSSEIIEMQGLLKEVDSLRIELEKCELRCEKLHKEKLELIQQQTLLLSDKYFEIRNSSFWKLVVKMYQFKIKYLSNQSPISIKINRVINYFKKYKKPIEDINNKWRYKKYIIHKIKNTTQELTISYTSNPVVSIIIPVFNGWEMTYNCINSIIKEHSNFEFEIIVADDNSTDVTIDCTKIIKNIVHVKSVENVGFIKNCNNAAKQARGKYVLFLNNDTEVTSGWLDSLVTLIESNENIGMVGSKLIFPNGKLQEAGGIIWSDASACNYGKFNDPGAPEYNYVKEVDYISGASILLPLKLWKEVGGFDERYVPAYYEDSDLAFSIRQLGYKVLYQPLSVLIHYEGFSHGTDKEMNDGNNNVKSFQKVNRIKFYEKWKNVLTDNQHNCNTNIFNARDRSKSKKLILVIDQFVPTYDKDAGSKTTYQYLELFAELGLNVKFIGDDFKCLEPYTTAIEQLGIEVLYGKNNEENWKNWIIDNSESIDYVYLNRPGISLKYIQHIKTHTKAKIFFYGHDLHFIRERKRYEIENKPELLESSNQWKIKECILFDQTDVILTPNYDECDIIRKINTDYNVKVILPFFYKTKATPIDSFDNRKDILFVGGFNHAPNVDAVLWFCSEIWPKVLKVLPEANFYIVGSNAPKIIAELKSDSIKYLGYQTDEQLLSLYKNVKLTVIPLRYGAGVKGKTIEAMQMGVPIVTTNIGVEGMVDVKNIINAKDDAEGFAEEIITLYNNNLMLSEKSKKEADYINTHFSQSVAMNTMTKLLYENV
jgi:GT2 family glycosyltransferase/glycosyltransferase involved in cell wall biosynthesis